MRNVSLLTVIAGGLVSATLAGAQLPTVARQTLVEELRISAAAHGMSQVGFVRISPKGVVSVGQSQDHQIRLLSSAGAPIATVGRKGSGPGEFQNVGSIRSGWVGDTLWAYDGDQLRFTLVGPDGKKPRNVSIATSLREPTLAFLNRGRVIRSFSPLAYYQDGSTFGTGRYSFLSKDKVDPNPLVKLFLADRSGAIVKEMPLPLDTGFARGITAGGGGATSSGVPWFAKPRTAVSADGRWYATLETVIRSSAQRTLRIRGGMVRGPATLDHDLAVTDVPIPADSLRVARDRFERSFRGEAPEVSAQMRAHYSARIPRAYPPYDQFLIANDGSMLLSLRVSATRHVVTILDTAARVVSTVSLPRGGRIETFDRSTLWVVEEDASGEESIVRYRIR
jgi:hypothetical protein